MSRLLNRKIPFVSGKKIPLSLPRRFIGDILHFAKRVPSIPMQRTMRLADVIEARGRLPQRFSWCAIFMKAWSLVASRRPELRRTYISFPWGYLYEHPINVASFSLERTYRGEEGVFMARIAQPESISLRVLDQMVRAHKTAEIESIDSYRQALWVSSLPLPIRRLAWWWALEMDGRYKAPLLGTFTISVVASLGAAGLHLLTPMSMALNYGTFAPDGNLDFRLTYDHRVIDGATAARALVALEEVLHQEVREELLNEAAKHSEEHAAANELKSIPFSPKRVATTRAA